MNVHSEKEKGNESHSEKHDLAEITSDLCIKHAVRQLNALRNS